MEHVNEGMKADLRFPHQVIIYNMYIFIAISLLVHSACYELNICFPPPNLYVEVLIFNVVMFRGGDFGK